MYDVGTAVCLLSKLNYYNKLIRDNNGKETEIHVIINERISIYSVTLNDKIIA
jgi:hypothetical protein